MLKVGQKLWYVSNQNVQSQYEVTVTSVGRKWASLDGGATTRINVETLRADAGQHSSPGACYLSREDYELENRRCRLWRELVRGISYAPARDSVTIEQIDAFGTIAFGELAWNEIKSNKLMAKP